MKLKVKILALALAVVFLIPFASACSKPQDTASTTDSVSTKATGAADALPALDYGGKDLRIYTWTTTNEWVFEEESKTAAQIDYKSYEHISAVEQRLGVKFVLARRESGGWGKHEEFIATLDKSVTTGDAAYDLVCQYSLAAAIGAMQGTYRDLGSMKYFNDFKGEYWSDDLIKSNTIGKNIYYVTGDMSGTVVRNMGFILYNKTLRADYGIEDLYALVRSGEWTLEKLRTIIADVYTDVDGDGKTDTDFYGLVVPANNYVDFLQYGGDLRCIVPDGDSWKMNPEFTDTGEKAINLSTSLRQLILGSQGTYFPWLRNREENNALFANKQTIFQVSISNFVIRELNEADVVYGILPMPKYNTDQEDYTTALSMVYSMFSIPRDAPDAEMSSAVMEAMGSNGYTKLTPYIFEVALKSRHSDEPADAEMLNYIRSGIIYEPGRIFTTIDCFALMRRSVQYDAEWASWYKSEGSAYAGLLDDILFELG